MLAAKVVNGRAARVDLQVVVEDHVAAGRQPRVQHLERQPRGVVSVAVEAEQRPAVAAQRRQRLLEEAGHEAHAMVEAQAGEAVPDLVQRNGQEVACSQVGAEVVSVPLGFRRPGEPLEGVGYPNYALAVAEGAQGRPHQDRSAAAPGPRLDQIAFDSLAGDRFDAGLEVVEAGEPDHR